ncbi:MAG: sulfatase-like hydrolase/transferase [Planctomycetes bacterium]|nr:sulfatase-like hydrolase/transferase [Planctomycetota bacterium]
MQPNVLFIMTDQQRYDGMSCHGGQARTPNLDRLAAGGADFRQFFTQAPVCAPSRCNLFTGRYGHSHGVRENNARLDRHEVHLFKALKQAGYHLGYIEKNHLLEKEEFDNFDLADLEETRKAEGERAAFVQFSKQQHAKLRQIGAWASATFHDFDPKVTSPYLSRQNAVSFIQDAPKDRPFCLAVSFSDPHAPHVALRKYDARYPLDKIRLPEYPPDVLAGKAPRLKIKQEAQGSLKASDADKRRYLAVYFSMLSWLDENIGEILSALDASGRRKDTIVVFTTDHGDFGFDYGMCKKDLVLLDCLLHVPLILAWDGYIAPKIVDGTMAEQVDVMPTLLDLCGVEMPFGCQGRSLAPLLRGETERHKDTIYAEICPPDYRNPYKSHDEFIADWNRNHETPGHPLRWTANYNVPGDFVKAIRTPEWKYVWYADGFEELYDLRNDPNEWVNLAGQAEYRATRELLKMRLLEWHALSEDPLDQMWHNRHLAKYDRWK